MNADTVMTQTLNRSFATNSAKMQLQACIQGLDIALLPIFVADTHIKSGELIELFPQYTTYPERGIYAMYPQNRYLSARTRLFIDWLSESSKAYSWC